MRNIQEHVDHQDGQDVAGHSPRLRGLSQEEDSQQDVDLEKKYCTFLFKAFF